MTLRLTLLDKAPLATAGADPGLRVWSYTIDSDSDADFGDGDRLAIGFPVGITIEDPADFPADIGLARIVEGAAGASWR